MHELVRQNRLDVNITKIASIILEVPLLIVVSLHSYDRGRWPSTSVNDWVSSFDSQPRSLKSPSCPNRSSSLTVPTFFCFLFVHIINEHIFVFLHAYVLHCVWSHSQLPTSTNSCEVVKMLRVKKSNLPAIRRTGNNMTGMSLMYLQDTRKPH